jgi:hypothetical protein
MNVPFMFTVKRFSTAFGGRPLEAYEEEDRKRRLGADSLIPKRIKFQKFGR